jgi:glycosyltransferase involved in cell wall biosynthesis
LPVGEALSIGIPVMASDIPVFHEIYGEAIDVYVDPHDTASMAEGIERLLENRAQFASAGRSIKEWLSRYQWPAVVAQYRDLCRDLIGKRPP